MTRLAHELADTVRRAVVTAGRELLSGRPAAKIARLSRTAALAGDGRRSWRPECASRSSPVTGRCTARVPRTRRLVRCAARPAASPAPAPRCWSARRSSTCGRRAGCSRIPRSRWARSRSAPRRWALSPARCPAAMLRDVGCRYVLVGHSERRAAVRRDRRAGGAQVHGRAGARAWCPCCAWARRSRNARAGERTEVVTRQLEAVLSVSGVGGAGQRGDRLRAGLGDRHGPHGDARSRRRRSTP